MEKKEIFAVNAIFSNKNSGRPEFIACRDRIGSDSKTIKIPAAFFPLLPVPGEVVYATYDESQMTTAVGSNYKTLRGGSFSLSNPDAVAAPEAPVAQHSSAVSEEDVPFK